ncbi:hypothetical protein ABZS29_38570 [Kribbella sp. NPDC005582]|uniref:hypothetical protein n=1 Tax=Kribbella sp. NPDC005582 TaxID=3156893 RepID=UPI0033A7D9A5
MSWFLMTAFGAAAMFCMRFTPPKVDFILVRVAGFSFVGAGLIGAAGWVGGLINGTLGWLFRFINDLSNSALGTGVAWIVAAAIAGLWIGGMLPDKVFSYDPPDWLVIAGLIVPALVAKVPGKAGSAFDTVITAGGQGLTDMVGRLF